MSESGVPPPSINTRRPPAPFPQQVTGDPRDQMRQIADALSRKADINGIPAFTAILLTDPDGIVWRVTVATNGALQTVQVPRT